ncbi:MAG: hypothetical protein IJ180_04465 [Bacteroidales bacterium]|nr:hypothetical protein [Bacteroidales bacterium]
MIELDSAEKFISAYEKIHKQKVFRIPYTSKVGERKTILMCKKNNKWISLPYMSVGVIENKITDKRSAPFQLFESEEGNFISTGRKPWEVRDTVAHSQYIYSDKVITLLDIKNEENVFNLFHSDIRRKIRKSIKEGVVVEYGTSKKFVKLFHKAYSNRMKEIGVAVISKKEINRRINAGLTTIFIAKKDNKVIGTATLNDMLQGCYENEFFATLSSFNKYYTSYLLHYTMICFAKENNATTYSFGRSTRNGGVHTYKRHWKAKDYNLFWSYSEKRKNIRDNTFLIKIWNKLPQFIKNILGGIIARKVY